MSDDKKQVRYDLDGPNLKGTDPVTTAIRILINQFPGLSPGDEITFAVLGEDSGKAMFPISGAAIETDKEDITGHVTQVCLYPFYVIYRAAGLSENRKAAVKEWLDNLGKWLEMQEVTINNEPWKLDGYPELTGNREFLSISRQTPGHLDSVNENKSENWAIYISARYRNEFDR